MITLDITQSGVPAEHRFSDVLITRLLEALALHIVNLPNGEITVSFVSDDEIRRLNRMYRHKDAVTDVLSFPSGDAPISGCLGDVLIAYNQAVRQADGDVALELADLLVHGILHILGYDHEVAQDADVMFPLQDALVAQIL